MRSAWRERLRSVDPNRLVFVDECSTNIALGPRYARAPKGERAFGKAPRNWGTNITLISSIILDEGLGASMSIEGSADRDSFSLYLKEVLCPALRLGQIVVMDNLSVHKSKYVRELIEQEVCELWFLPAYSPDFNPIEEAFSKAKARTLEALFEATAKAQIAVGEEDAAASSATATTPCRGLIVCPKLVEYHKLSILQSWSQKGSTYTSKTFAAVASQCPGR